MSTEEKEEEENKNTIPKFIKIYFLFLNVIKKAREAVKVVFIFILEHFSTRFSNLFHTSECAPRLRVVIETCVGESS